MRSSVAASVGCLLCLVLALRPAHALQFEAVTISPTEVIVGGRGPIVQGDTTRLLQALANVPREQRMLALALDSPGGSVAEGEQLSHLIRARALTVVVPSNSKCVSACFLLFAASPRRLAAADALVGVHSANENGEETDAALAVTTLMARDAAALGIPPAIICKMVLTTPGRVEWLSPDDLASMNVTVFNSDAATAARQVAAANVHPLVPATPAAPPPVAPQVVPAAPAASTAAPPIVASPFAPAPGGSAAADVAAGRNDRRAWDSWFGGLSGAYRDGATFAQSQAGLPQPGSCYGPNGVNRGDFTLGCEIARQRLAQVAVRMRASPDYVHGWNTGSQPLAPNQLAEAEYQGAYFCGRQMARLTLTVFPDTGEPRRRAMFSFGPETTSPEVPHGSFIVQGSIDLHGGVMALTPVSWVSQPPGYGWLGLNGRSDDGGRTFTGRVTESPNCTVFTLKRMSGASAAR
jgi:hypothetical protein